MPEALIVRLPNWLGDTVMAVPALRALRAHWRGSRVLLAGPWARLLAGQDLADVLVDYPRDWAGRLRMTGPLRRFRADLAVLLPSSFEAALAAHGWGARAIVGFATGGRSWLLSEGLSRPSPRLHQVDEYLLLVEALGAPVASRMPTLAPPPPESPERERAQALLQQAGAWPRAVERPLVGMQLGAAHGPAKTWPADRAAAFCRQATAGGAVVVLLGAPADVPVAEAIRREADVLCLVGRDSPALLPALLSQFDAIVSGDTGVAHLAAALGVPVVTLFGPTDPALSAPRGEVTIVRHAVPCAPCSYRACPIDHGCMRGIDPEEVAGRLWLAARQRPA